MLPDISHVDHYFELLEFFLFRVALFTFFVLGLYRLVRRHWRK